MAKRCGWLLVLPVLAGLGPGAAVPAGKGDKKNPDTKKLVDVSWGVKIPLRDGVKLNATLYRPAKPKNGLPALFTLTPYLSDSHHDRAMFFARHGYACALVDVRGRGNSEGKFEPFVHDGWDGHDVVEWLA